MTGTGCVWGCVLGRIRAPRAAGTQRPRRSVEDFAWRVVRAGDPVTLRYAERVLGVSNPTVRDWVRAGILEDFAGSPQRGRAGEPRPDA